MVPARNNWLAAGDPLRGIAASGVLLFHVATWAALTGTDPAHAPTFGVLGPVVHNLDAGVFLFFLLSGYLIGRPFASAFVMQTPFPRPSRFLARRALRLAPGALGGTALALVGSGAASGTGRCTSGHSVRRRASTWPCR